MSTPAPATGAGTDQLAVTQLMSALTDRISASTAAGVQMSQATVVGVNADGTVSVSVAGDATPTPAYPLDSYTPKVGDEVWLLQQQGYALVVDSLTPTGPGAAPRPATALPSGTVLPFAGAVAPQGFLLCNGEAAARSTYPLLFAAIGTIYGPGDGTTTFGLPNLAGAVPVGVGLIPGSSPAASYGLGFTGGGVGHQHTTSGNSGNDIEAHTHMVSGTSGNEIESHTHAVSGTSGNDIESHTHTVATTVAAESVGHNHGYFTATQSNPYLQQSGGESNTHGHSFSATSATENNPHAHSVSATSATETGAHGHTVMIDSASADNLHQHPVDIVTSTQTEIPVCALNYIIAT